MRTRMYAVGGLAVLAAIVVAAIIVTSPIYTEASVEDMSMASARDMEISHRADSMTGEDATRPDGLGQLQATPDSDSPGKPYIGVVVSAPDDGSVAVLKVLVGGPSEGILESGDVITAVDGEAIDGAEDLTDAIAESGVGETVTLTVTRDGSEMDVTITVGEWTDKSYGKSSAFPGSGRMHNRVASAQIVKADEDGNYHTYRTVFGSITELDENAGTFTIEPKDGSDAIEYTVDDDTRIYVGKDRVDDLSGLDTDLEAVTMDVDGVVKVVKQSDADGAAGIVYHMGRIHRFGSDVGANFHRISPQRAKAANVRMMTDRFDVDATNRMRGLRFGRDLAAISSVLEEIDDSVIATYAPDGFEGSFERFLEDPGSGGRISVRRDGAGLNVSLKTEDGLMSFTIPESALNDDDSP